jgi:hypothetical protein
MCLNNPKGPFIAEEDVVCYKNIVKTVSEKELAKAMDNLNSVKFSGVIDGVEVSGLLVKDNERFYFFQNKCDGNKPTSFWTIGHDYKYSWELDITVLSVNIILSDSSVIVISADTYMTPYQSAIVEIGNLYESEIEFEGNNIEKALHSFVDIVNCITKRHRLDITVKCIIPKGSTYYIGDFSSAYNNNNSYASNQLKYLEIIE